MGIFYTKYGYKRYIKIPFGEIQYGQVSKKIDIWFMGKVYRVKRGKWINKEYEKLDHGKPNHVCLRRDNA